MGSWGTGPFDNDDAADIAVRMMKPIDTVVRRKTDRSAQYHYNEARAAAQFILLSHATDILGGPSLAPVLWALERMRADENWIDTWEDRWAILGALDREIREIRRKIKAYNGCQTGTRHWADVSGLKQTTSHRSRKRRRA